MTTKKKNSGGVKRSIRAQVMAEICAAHAEEYHARMAHAYTEAGLTYIRPLTAEEKAAIKERKEFEAAKEQFDALVAKFPGLRPVAMAAAAVDDEGPEPFDDAEDAMLAASLGIDSELSKATPAP